MEKLQFTTTEQDAIANAVTIGYYRVVIGHLTGLACDVVDSSKLDLSFKDILHHVFQMIYNPDNLEIVPSIREALEYKLDDPEVLFRGYTYKACLEGSIQALHYLSERYNQLFDRLFIINSYSTRKESIRGNFYGHYYFIARSKRGIYYAASPGNYQVTSMDIVSSNSIQELLTELQRRDGGILPDLESIEAYLESNYTPFTSSQRDDRHIETKTMRFFRNSRGLTIYDIFQKVLMRTSL